MSTIEDEETQGVHLSILSVQSHFRYNNYITNHNLKVMKKKDLKEHSRYKKQ